MPNPSEDMIKTLTTDLNKLRPVYTRIEALLASIKAERDDDPSLRVAKPAEAEFKRLDDAAKKMSSRTTKEDVYKAARKDLTALVSGKKLEKRETDLKAALVRAKAWTITVNARTDSWVSSHSAGSQFDKLQEEIKKTGVDAGGLRHITGDVYDWHVPGVGDYRVVGVANRHTHQFTFQGVYQHGGPTGKSFVDGERVSGY